MEPLESRNSNARRSFVLLAAASCAFLMHARSAGASDVLTGKMARFIHLLGGSWSCSTSVPPMNAQGAHTDQSTATFEIVPGNVLHNHLGSDDYSGDFYIGYNERTNEYWQTGADSLGMQAFLSSSDAVRYSGTSSMGPITVQDRITYARVGQNKVSAHEVLSGPRSQTVFDTVCTR